MVEPLFGMPLQLFIADEASCEPGIFLSPSELVSQAEAALADKRAKGAAAMAGRPGARPALAGAPGAQAGNARRAKDLMSLGNYTGLIFLPKAKKGQGAGAY